MERRGGWGWAASGHAEAQWEMLCGQCRAYLRLLPRISGAVAMQMHRIFGANAPTQGGVYKTLRQEKKGVSIDLLDISFSARRR